MACSPLPATAAASVSRFEFAVGGILEHHFAIGNCRPPARARRRWSRGCSADRARAGASVRPSLARPALDTLVRYRFSSSRPVMPCSASSPASVTLAVCRFSRRSFVSPARWDKPGIGDAGVGEIELGEIRQAGQIFLRPASVMDVPRRYSFESACHRLQAVHPLVVERAVVVEVEMLEAERRPAQRRGCGSDAPQLLQFGQRLRALENACRRRECRSGPACSESVSRARSSRRTTRMVEATSGTG